VANRIAQIRDGSTPSQWRYVDSSSNPADHASRGLSADELLNNKEWIRGPDFLWKTEDEWPQRPPDMAKLCEDDTEVKREVKPCLKTLTLPTRSLKDSLPGTT